MSPLVLAVTLPGHVVLSRGDHRGKETPNPVASFLLSPGGGLGQPLRWPGDRRGTDLAPGRIRPTGNFPVAQEEHGTARQLP